VLARCAPRKRHTEFVAFLDQLDRAAPKRRDIHLILDNYSTHTHPAVEAWFAARPRYHRHFVPTSASWLNLVERWFAEITRKRIRRGTFRSVAALIRAIDDYVTHHNRHAEPFIWTATAAVILKKVRHCKEVLETAHYALGAGAARWAVGWTEKPTNRSRVGNAGCRPAPSAQRPAPTKNEVDDVINDSRRR
jgi:transposase